MRKRELLALRKYVLCDALLKVNWGVIPAIVGLVTFLVHTKASMLMYAPSSVYDNNTHLCDLEYVLHVVVDVRQAAVCQ